MFFCSTFKDGIIIRAAEASQLHSQVFRDDVHIALVEIWFCRQ